MSATTERTSYLTPEDADRIKGLVDARIEAMQEARRTGEWAQVMDARDELNAAIEGLTS